MRIKAALNLLLIILILKFQNRKIHIMKGLAAIAMLMTATQAGNIEERLHQIVDKNELHLRKAQLLNELEMIDHRIHAVTMSANSSSNATATAATNSSSNASTTKNTTAASTNTTSTNASTNASTNGSANTTAAAASSGGSAGLIIGIVAVLAIGGGALWYCKNKKGDSENEGGEKDDRFSKFLDDELNN